ARCTAGCNTSTPSWQVLPVIDSGIANIIGHTGEDEARPITVKVSPAAGGTILVAYYTGDNTVGTAFGQPPCAVTVAQFDGAAWHRLPVPPLQGTPGCTTNGFAWGRYLSMDIDPASGGPMLAYSEENGANWTDGEFNACTTAQCTT